MILGFPVKVITSNRNCVLSLSLSLSAALTDLFDKNESDYFLFSLSDHMSLVENLSSSTVDCEPHRERTTVSAGGVKYKAGRKVHATIN